MKTIKYLLITALILSLFSCSDFEEIKLIEMKKVEVKELNAKGVYLNISAVLENPNNMKFTVADSDIQLKVNNQDLGTVSLVNPVKIDKNCKKQYDVALFCKFENLSLATIPVLVSTFSGKSAQVNLKGKVKARKFLFTKTFPIEINDKVSF